MGFLVVSMTQSNFSLIFKVPMSEMIDDKR